MKYSVNYGDADKTIFCTSKDVNGVIDKFDEKERSINWIEDDAGFRVADRLTPTISTAKNKLKLK